MLPLMLSLAVQRHKEHQHWQYFSLGVVVSMVSSFVSIVSRCFFIEVGCAWLDAHWSRFSGDEGRPTLSLFICLDVDVFSSSAFAKEQSFVWCVFGMVLFCFVSGHQAHVFLLVCDGAHRFF